MATDRTAEGTPSPVVSLRDVDIEAWRLLQLLRAGYPNDLAGILAKRGDIDLHVACDLIARDGATLRQALDILL